MHGNIPIKQEPIRILRFSSRLLCHLITIIITPTQVLRKVCKKILRNIHLELKHPIVLTFYFANLASNSMKFLIHKTRSRHLLLKLNTFINLNMITKLSAFISKVSRIYCSWFESLLRELRLRSRDANCSPPAAKIIYQSCMPCGPIYIDIGYNAEEKEGKKWNFVSYDIISRPFGNLPRLVISVSRNQLKEFVFH